MDPFIGTARYTLKQSLNDLRGCLDGLSVDALNWRPPAGETNSIAVLTVHAMSSTRSWLSIATGAPLPERDRDREFEASAASADELRAWFDDMASQCAALLDTKEPVDWSAMRATHARPNPGDPEQVPAAFALVHALEHLREHVGQTALTRQLWLARE